MTETMDKRTKLSEHPPAVQQAYHEWLVKKYDPFFAKYGYLYNHDERRWLPTSNVEFGFPPDPISPEEIDSDIRRRIPRFDVAYEEFVKNYQQPPPQAQQTPDAKIQKINKRPDDTGPRLREKDFNDFLAEKDWVTLHCE